MVLIALIPFMLMVLPINDAGAQPVPGGVYCRYELDGQVHYGRVEGATIHTLNNAPWEGGRQTGATVAVDSVRLLHPSVPRVIVGLGAAYREAWEGKQVPNTVRWFIKPPTSAASPGEDIVLPAAIEEVRVEVELVIVLGKTVKNATEEEAAEAIFGYTVGNEIGGSVEDYRNRHAEPEMQEVFLAGGMKMGDGFAPFGPYIRRGLEGPFIRRLEVRSDDPTRVVRTEHSTANLLYSPAKIISDLSRIFTLSPGDVIFTGTNASHPVRAGDEVRVEIEGLGSLLNRFRSAD